MKAIITCLGLTAVLWMACSKKQDQEISAEEMLSEQKDTVQRPETPPPPPPKIEEEEAYQPRISKDGPYVVQISVYANRGAANRLAQRLTGEGYPAYVAEVESPTTELSGTFYRVRVAGFDGVSLAKEFGQKIIEKMGYEFWVDNKTNDNAGAQPAYAPAASSYSTTPESSYPKVQETPSQTPASTYESTPYTSPAPASTPTSDWGSPATTPAATPAATPEATPAPTAETTAPAAPAPSAAPAPATTPESPSTPAQSPSGGTGGDWDWDSKSDSSKSDSSKAAPPADKGKSEWDF